MKIRSSEKLLEWSERIKQQKLSNKSVALWCQEQGFSLNTFHYWQKKIKQASAHTHPKSTFFEIPEHQPFIEVVLRGAKLTISKDFDLNALIHFLNLLKVE